MVLSLLANEEMGPQQVIPLLKPTLRMKVSIHSALVSPYKRISLGVLLWHMAALRQHRPFEPRQPKRKIAHVPSTLVLAFAFFARSPRSVRSAAYT